MSSITNNKVKELGFNDTCFYFRIYPSLKQLQHFSFLGTYLRFETITCSYPRFETITRVHILGLRQLLVFISWV